jgi:hypothetical protein
VPEPVPGQEQVLESVPGQERVLERVLEPAQELHTRQLKS